LLQEGDDMAARIKEKVLDEKMDSIRKAKDLSRKALEKIESLIREGSDYDLFRVNPVRFAADRGLIEYESIDVFLHGARNGMFQMEWNLVCPMCGDSVDSYRSLSRLNSHYYCAMCDLSSEATLDDYIQVSFTVSPEIREIAYHRPESLSIDDYLLKYHFNPGAAIPGGPRFIDALPQFVKGLSYVGPGQKKRFEIKTTGGSITLNDLMHHQGALVAVKGEPAARPQALTVRLEPGKLVVDRAQVAPWKVVVAADNRTAARASMLILGFPPGFERKRLIFEPFLSGKRLISMQTFRDLFSSEVIQATEGIGVRDLTILFTDLKGSTALYERIGDLKAFSMVRQHFDKLGRVIRENSGAFVKTIGDAVMASFLNPLDAMKAALEMNREINRFNRAFSSRDMILKIGIHKGPCIAVTLNDRLDYFGQTVNTAARVQRLAGAEEVYVTEEVFSFSGVKPLLKGYRVFGGRVKLRGTEEQMQVYKIAAPDYGDGRTAAGSQERATAAGLRASAGAAAARQAQ
jgi:class 3 adenylate cyclase